MRLPHIRHLILALMAAASLMAIGGCGDDDDDNDSGATASEAAAVKLPSSSSGPSLLDPGKTYETTTFRPKLTFKVPAGEWTVPFPESATDVAVQRGAPRPTEQSILAFFHIEGVFDPKEGGRIPDDAEQPPADFVDWLVEHPRLKATKPVPVELGSLRGRQVDVEVKSASTEQPAECEGRPCLPLYTSGGELAQFGVGNRMRYMVFEDEPEPLVVEMFVNPGEQFDAEVPELEKFLRGVQVGS